MSVCNKNFNSKISVQSGYLEFSLVAASTEIPKCAPILHDLSCGPTLFLLIFTIQSNLPTTGLREAVRLSTTVRPLGTEYFLHVCNGFFDSK